MIPTYHSLSKKYIYVLFAFVLLANSAWLSAQTVVLAENFNDCQLASGWSTEVVEGLVDWQFGYIDNSNAWAGNSMNGSCFAFFDDEANGGNTLPSIVRLASPVFNAAEFAEYTLQFDAVFRKQEDLEHFSVFIFDGTTYSLVIEYYDDVGGEQFTSFQTVSLDLSAFRTETMQIVFHYDDGGDEGWWLGLDNISVTGTGILNDYCQNAIDLSLGEPCLAANNSTAVFTGTPPSCYDKNIGALWYRFISPISGIVKIETEANFNDLITVYQGDCNNMNPLACQNRDEHGFIGETHYMSVNAATTYMIRVNGVDADFGPWEGDLCISIEEVNAFPVPPVNDVCNNAITLTVDSTDCIIGNNRDATFTGPEPSLNLKTRSDIWYSFLATASSLEITTAADFADVIAVYSGTCSDLTEVAVNEFGQRLLLENLVIGTTYYIQVGGFFATLEGGLCMQVSTPIIDVADNDLCGNATMVTVDGDCVEGENTFASFDGPSPGCEIFPTANVWYQFVAPASGTLQINTGTTFPHVVSVYSGDCNNFEEILCLENPLYCDGYFGLSDLVPGETYFMQVAAAENGFGYILGELCMSIVSLGSPQIFDPLEAIVEVNCINSGISVLNVLPSGGQGAYTIEGHTTGDTLLTGQDYFTVVRDAEGCEVAINGTVDCGNLPCALGATVSSTGATCYNSNTGTATVDVLPANGPFSFTWSTGSTASSVQNLTAGIYFVTVENAAGCSDVFSVAITNPTLIIANATATPETGQGTEDGTATANPTGGTAPYTYIWSYNNETTQTITGLPPDFYSVVIFDANGCSNVATVNVSSFDCVLSVNILSENISCNGLNDGELTVVEASGMDDLTYLWSNGATTQTLQNLPAGTYSVTTTDPNACQTITTATITEPAVTVGMLQSSADVSCFGFADGAATLQVTGGAEPYAFDWPGGVSGAVQTTLLSGNYEVTFTDANGCSGTIPVTISEPALLETSIADATQVSCYNNSNGQATVFAQGGTPGYDYQWDDPMSQSSATAVGLSAGTYSVTVTDNNMCTSTVQTTITEPDLISISVDAIVDEVGDLANGAISITPTGGTPPYTFNWVLGGTVISNEEDVTGLEAAANYRVQIIDANGCSYISAEFAIQSLTGVSDPELEGVVTISPNPTDGKFFVEIGMTEQRVVAITIFDMLGRVIVAEDFGALSEGRLAFDLEEAGAGMYVVRVLLGDGVYVGGVVVE